MPKAPMAGDLAPGRWRRWGSDSTLQSPHPPVRAEPWGEGGQLRSSPAPEAGPGSWLGGACVGQFLPAAQLGREQPSSPKLPGEGRRASWKAAHVVPHSVMEKMVFNPHQSWASCLLTPSPRKPCLTPGLPVPGRAPLPGSTSSCWGPWVSPTCTWASVPPEAASGRLSHRQAVR